MEKKEAKRKKIYFDYASTTPVDPRVMKAMLPYFSEKFGNTMSLHSLGQEAKVALEESREKVADFIGAKPNEIIFTASATESNNLALKGVAFAAEASARRKKRFISSPNRKKGNHIIISSIEHPCIMESAKWLEDQGYEITRLKVNKYGLVNLNELKRAIKKETVLVSIIHASNEIGTIEPIAEIEKIIEKFNTQNPKSRIYFHTDAAQSFGKVPIDVKKINIDLLTASSHKVYGPKGAAFLYMKEGTEIEPILHGGGQEQGLRSSTINLAVIVGFAQVCQIAEKEMKKENQRIERLSKKLIKGILEKIPNSYLNGLPQLARAGGQAGLQNRLPNILNFRFDFVEGESIVVQLDLMGIAVSTGSACSSVKLEPNHVLLAIGLRHEQAHGSLRISLGRWTKESEINYLLKVLPGVIKNLRKISPLKFRK